MSAISIQQANIENLAVDFPFRLSATSGTAAECKALLQEMQQSLYDAFIFGVDAALLVAGRAQLVDGLLQYLWARENWKKPDNLCLVAVGGYGRAELHPHSDVDILILFEKKLPAADQAAIESMITFLWDCGLDLGHSVRNLKECASYANEDITVLTNLLESRHIAGSEPLFEKIAPMISEDKMWSSSEFFLAKWEEQRKRHQQVNNIEYNLEPNLKTSPGGLRDIQTIVWIAKRHLGEGNINELAKRGFLTGIEAENFIEGMQFLWRARYALHMVANRHEDRLLFDYQVKIAEYFGFRDDNANLAVEKFMHEYHRRVLRLAVLNDVLIQHFDQDIVRKGEKEQLLELNERFVVRNDYIDVVDEQVFEKDLWALLEIFVLMAEHQHIRGVRASTIRLMRTYRERIDDDFRRDPKVIGLFNRLLSSGSNVPLQLKRMRRHGVLSKYLPAFGEIVGKMQYDLFHIYTVDIHTLEVVENIYRFVHEASENDLLLATRIANGQLRIEILYMAALFHDIAKGRGGDHSQLGANDARQFCELHGFNNRDTNIVVWLVESHLIMSTESQKQDLSDPDVIRRFALKVGDRSRLDYLYVLTVADIKGTSPELWNAWRSSLLRQLYAGATRALRRGLENPVDKHELIEEKRAAAMEIVTRAGIDSMEVLRQWKNRVDEYFLRESVEDLALHAQAICAHGSSEEPLVIIKKAAEFSDSSATQITIYCQLKENRFSYITMALEQLNLSIYDARLLVMGGGDVLDTYYVLDTDGEEIDHNSDRIDQIRARLLVAMSDERDKIMENRRRTPRRLKSFDWPSQTVFTNEYSRGFSVLEVVSPDRPGLLTEIAQVFYRYKLRLHNAKISTLGERVEDVFFLTDREDRIIDNPETIESFQHDLKLALDEMSHQ